MMSGLTSTERVKRVLAGEKTDRPLYSAWGHFMNYADRNAVDFANATIAFQELNGFDTIKVMSNPFYLLEDMGIQFQPVTDFRNCVSRSKDMLTVAKPSGWDKVKLPDLKQGAMAREIEAIKRIVDHFQGDVPVLPSIFTPIMWITYASIPSPEIDVYEDKYGSYVPLLEKYLTENEPATNRAVARLSEFNQEYMETLLNAGVDGFFYATDVARDLWSDNEIFEKYERTPDLQALNSLDDRAWFNMLHICGEDRLLLDEVLDYPVQAFNWDDQMEGTPSFAELRKKTDKILVGGLNRKVDFRGEDRERIKIRIQSRIYEALRQGGENIMISGGCAWDFDSAYKFFIWKEIMDEYGQ